MKALKAILCVTLLWLFSYQLISAQDWHPFPGDWEYVYGQSPSPTKPEGLAVIGRDSLVLEGGDWVTYFNRITHIPVGDSACDAFGFGMPLAYKGDQDNIFGKKLIAKPGGVFEFVYSSGDTIHLETAIPVSGTFTFHADSAVTATLTSRSVGTILGGLDSLLTYTLSNGRIIQLSQHHGLVKAYNFKALAEEGGLPGMTVTRTTILRHLDSLPGQESHPEFDDVFNFDIGDRMQYLVHYLGGSGEYYEWKDYTVLTKSVNTDSSLFIYDMLEAKKKYLNIGGIWDTTYYPPAPIVATFSAFDYKHLDSLLPGEMNDDVFYLDGIHQMPDWNGRLGLGFVHKPFLIYDTCSAGYWIFENERHSKYGVGLGRVHYEDADVSGYYSEDLICYQKATDSAGICENVILAVQDPLASLHIRVYPNPSSDELRVSASTSAGPMDWQLMDIHGRQILAGRNAGDWPIDIRNLQSGVYFLRAVTGAGQVAVKKVVKE